MQTKKDITKQLTIKSNSKISELQKLLFQKLLEDDILCALERIESNLTGKDYMQERIASSLRYTKEAILTIKKALDLTHIAPFSEKAPKIQSLLENFVHQEFGKSRQAGTCVICDNPKILTRADFKDELSWKEFSISRLCQKCQDCVFDVPENGEPTGKCPNCGDLCYNGGTCCSEECEKEYIAYVESSARNF